MESLQFSTKYLLKPEAEALLMKQITQLHNIIDLQKENNQLIFKEGKLAGKEEGRKLGHKEGKAERNIEIARMMLEAGEPVEKIMFFTGLSVSEIQQLS